MKMFRTVAFLLLLSVPFNCQPIVIEEPQPNNAGKIVSYFLRDILGGIVGLKASEGNSKEAAAALKQVLHGTAGLVESVLEEQQTRGLLENAEEFEKVLIFIHELLNHSLTTEQGKEALLLFLQELKNIEQNAK